MHKVSGCIWVIQGHLGPNLELINIMDSIDVYDVYHFPRDHAKVHSSYIS